MPDDTITIRAPAGTKARWVHQAQAARLKLSAWVLERVEPKPAQQVTRPQVLPGGKRVTMYLDHASIEQARMLGEGNMSLGIRRALGVSDD